MNDDSTFYITTHSGTRFYFDHPHKDMVNLEDISQHLAAIRRFGGAGRPFISVAEHSVNVSLVCQSIGADPLWGLMHDATEAYIGDVVGPLKRMPFMQGYKDYEEKLMRTICQKFDMPFGEPITVKEVDRVMTSFEGYYSTLGQWPAPTSLPPYMRNVRLQFYDVAEAAKVFVARFHELTSKVPA